MTAALAVAGPARIDILADSASCDATTGALVALQSKLHVVHAHTVVVATGLQQFTDIVSAAVKRCPDFDATVSSCYAIWRHAKGEVAPFLRKYADLGIAIILAGYSTKRDALELFCIANDDDLVYEVHAAGVGGASTCKATHSGFCQAFADQRDNVDPVAHGLAAMHELRQQPFKFEQGWHPCVGGFVEHAQITRSGCSIRRVHSWPDTIGRQITTRRMD